MNVETSKWLKNLDEYIATNKKKELKSTVISILIPIILLTLLDFFAVKKADDAADLILMTLFIILLLLLLFIFGVIKISTSSVKKVSRSLESLIKTSEELQLFDEELLGKPLEIADYKVYRFIFTEHFIVRQYKKAARVGNTMILRLEDIDRLQVILYTGATSGVKIFFYNNDNKKPLGYHLFSSNKLAAAFTDKFEKVKPSIITQK